MHTVTLAVTGQSINLDIMAGILSMDNSYLADWENLYAGYGHAS